MLGVRILSAVALGIPFLAAVYAGRPWFDLVILAGLVLLAWEWARVSGGHWLLDTVALAIGPVAAAAVAFAGRWEWALAVLALGLVPAGLVGLRRGAAGAAWAMGAVPYAGLGGLALLWLRDHGEAGWLAVLWVLLVVWATDTGAYAAGRTVGGPKLAPRASPNKTWSGLLGGMGCAALVGGGALALMPPAVLPLSPAWGLAAGALLAVVAQAGDLFESVLKRHFGVKDSSRIIPGHGGLLDRVDGLLTAAPVLVLLALAASPGGGG